jgi:ubiquinone/menaquinone biosynthesis C-methylase UbiE
MFREAIRVILPSGWFLSVDFVRIRNATVGRLYTFHIFRVLPALGSLVSKYWHRTLVYLANSIQVSDSAAEVCQMMREVGFRRAFAQPVTLGVVALVGGQK